MASISLAATVPQRLARLALLLSAAAIPQAAAATDLRDFCPDRPGLGTPACTIDKGHGDVELGLVDWTLTRDSGTRTDDLASGDLVLRYGLTDSLEAQVQWTATGSERVRAADGSISRSTGTGDVSFALRQNLSHPDGSGFSLAVMPIITLPTGSSPLGGGSWGASLLVPMSWQLPHGLQVDFTGEVDAAPNEAGRGRHLAYSGVAGLDAGLGHDVTATLELAALRDEDPSGASDQLIGGLSLAWLPRPNLQLDIGTNVGLAGAAPDVEIYAGISRRF